MVVVSRGLTVHTGKPRYSWKIRTDVLAVKRHILISTRNFGLILAGKIPRITRIICLKLVWNN